jgi:Fe-S cluster assembly scaffold protein SufB
MIRLFLKVLFAVLLVASFSDASEKTKIIAKDGQYVSYKNGIVYDEKTNLEWTVGPDKDTTWDEAKAWVESLSVEGGGWRMPTIAELIALYKKGAGSSNMTPLLKATGGSVWSGETEGSSTAWRFSFITGHEEYVDRNHSFYDRGFAVRSRK